MFDFSLLACWEALGMIFGWILGGFGIQVGAKIHQKSIQNGIKKKCKFACILEGSGTPLGPILEPTWPHLGSQNRSKRGPRAIQNAFKFVSYL